MTKKEIVNEFKTILKTDGQHAFKFLLKNLSSDTFIAEVIKQLKKENTKLNTSIFFDDFLSKGVYLEQVSKSKIFDELLHFYFTKYHSDSFLRNLNKIAPFELIKGVRLNQAFLDKKTLHVLQDIKFPQELETHQKTWTFLFEEDDMMWEAIKSKSKLWIEVSPALFLGNLINWMEEARFNNDRNEMLNHLASTYNFIISFYLSENDSEFKDLNDEVIENGYGGSFANPDLKLYECFTLIANWMKWSEALLKPYSYDLNTHPVFKGDKIDLEYYEVSKLENWQKDGERYTANNLRYKFLGALITNEMIRINKVVIPEGQTKEDTELFAQTQATESLLKDLQLNKIKINGKTIATKELLKPLLAYSMNRLHKYDYALDDIKKNAPSWNDSIKQLAKLNSSKNTDFEPYFFMTKENYIDLNQFAANEQQKDVFKEMVSQFSYRITKGKYTFKRHSIGYDVWQNPFVLLGNYMFCPMMFFARNEWFYSLAQIIIKSYNKDANNRKKSSIQMEEGLKDLFLEHNSEWRAFIPEFSHAGDIDLIVSDGATDLIIQLKRTSFRTELKDAYFEMVNSDRKAINQLNQGEEFIVTNSNHYALKESRYKWLVSTSFERVNQNFEGCRKINYLELIWGLKYKKFNTIEDLKNYMYSDKVLSEHKKFIDNLN